MGADTGAGGYPVGGFNVPRGDTGVDLAPGGSRFRGVGGDTGGSTFPGTGGYRPPISGGPGGIQMPVGGGAPIYTASDGSESRKVPPKLPTPGGYGGYDPNRETDGNPGIWQGMQRPVKPWLNPGPANPAEIDEIPTGGYMPPRDVPIQPMPSQPIYTVGGTRSDMAKPAVRPPMPTQGQGLTKPYAQPGPAQPAGGVGPYKPPQPDKPQFSTAQGMTKPAVRPPAYGKPGFGMKAPDPQTPPYAPYKKPETM